MSRQTATLGARVGAALRHHGPDSEQYIEARIEHGAALVDDLVQRVVDAEPALDSEQRVTLASRIQPTIDALRSA